MEEISFKSTRTSDVACDCVTLHFLTAEYAKGREVDMG